MTRRALPRRALVLAVVAGALALVVASWRAFGPGRTAVAPSGAALGALPGGVGAGDLNVIVITLDTTRWDRLGVYGYARAATPNLDRLGSEGVVFEQAIAAVPLTLPSHSTMFTGLLPPRHGVRDNGGYVLDGRHTTLAAQLKQAGWRTGAFVGAFVLDSKWGLNQGFETYVDQFDMTKYKTVSLGDIARRAGAVVDNAMPWLDAHASERFFAWLHFYDAHAPYDAPEPFKSRFADRPYDGEIAYVDQQIGRVLQWLEARGLTERTVIVAVGDHGESLDEHGENTHGFFVYEATTRVPFIVRSPYRATRGRRVASAVRTEDLMPTVLDLVGRAAPAGIQGRTLTPLLTGETGDLNLDAYSESLYPRHHYAWSDLKALRSGRFKYIETTRPELYDLERDPGEQRNLYDERRDLATRMATALAAMAAEEPDAPAGPATVDPETRERLAALGYIGSFANAPARAGEMLPDPKDKIQIFNLMTSAKGEGGEPKSGSAIARLTRVLEQDPNIVDAWVMLGNEHFREHRYAQALEQYQRALAINPDYDLATINLANAYRALGDDEAAILGYRKYLQRDPDNAWVRYQLGELLADRGDLDDAEQAFERALADDMRVAAARNALGVVAFKRGDLVKAEQQVRAALAQKPDVKLAHFNLALIAERRGAWQTAIEEYQKEIATQPDAYRAAFNLGKLFEQQGNAAAQEAAFKKAIDINPRFAEGYFFLAKLYLDQGREFDQAVTLATRGLEVGPQSEMAPLGHYVLADLYNRLGRPADSAREAALGRAREAQLRARKGRSSPRH